MHGAAAFDGLGTLASGKDPCTPAPPPQAVKALEDPAVKALHHFKENFAARLAALEEFVLQEAQRWQQDLVTVPFEPCQLSAHSARTLYCEAPSHCAPPPAVCDEKAQTQCRLAVHVEQADPATPTEAGGNMAAAAEAGHAVPEPLPTNRGSVSAMEQSANFAELLQRGSMYRSWSNNEYSGYGTRVRSSTDSQSSRMSGAGSKARVRVAGSAFRDSFNAEDRRREPQDARERSSTVVSEAKCRSPTVVSTSASDPSRVTVRPVTQFEGQAGEQRRLKMRSKIVQMLSAADADEDIKMRHMPQNWLRMLATKEFRPLALDSCMGVVIVMNVFLMGLSCDLAKHWFGWIVIDAVFAFLFVTEVFLKICIFGWREYAQGRERRWHFFEMVLSLAAIIEVTLAFIQVDDLSAGSGLNLSIVRLARAARIGRLVRLCRMDLFIDLMVMIRGTLGGAKTLLWSTVLICIPLYGMALGLRETLGGPSSLGIAGPENFATLPLSFFTIFRCIVSAECMDKSGRPIFELVRMRPGGWVFSVCYSCFQIFMIFGLFNVIVGIFVENVLLGAKTNDQVMKKHRLADQKFFARKLTHLLIIILDNHREFTKEQQDMTPTRTEEDPLYLVEQASSIAIGPAFLKVLHKNEQFNEIMVDLGLSQEDTIDLFDTLDVDCSGSVDTEELCDGLAKMRGEAKRKDSMTMMLLLQKLHDDYDESMQQVLIRLEQNEGLLMNLCRLLAGEPGVRAPTNSTSVVLGDGRISTERSSANEGLAVCEGGLLQQHVHITRM